MNRLQRYWKLWQTLPADERRERTGKLVERLLRRRESIRRTGIMPDQPRWSEFRRALRVPGETLCRSLRVADPRRGPLFADLEARLDDLAASCPGHLAELVVLSGLALDGSFDLLGSGPHRLKGPGDRVDWHLDWRSGKRWPSNVYHTELELVRGDGSDVKLPWELSRCQHLLVLAQAGRLATRLPIGAKADALASLCAAEVRVQIDDWIERNPRGLGIHWSCAMEVGIRAFVWLNCLALLRNSPELDDAFLERLVRSLWVHGRHIRRNLEHGGGRPATNHLLADLIGLYAIGCALPELHEARSWRLLARNSLAEEIERQVHTDGVDFERSIPYHGLVTEISVHASLLARASGEELPPSFGQRLSGMLEFIASYTRPDGGIPRWGDSDDGRLLPLDGYASSRPDDHRHLLALGGRLLDRDDLLGAARERDVEARWLLDPAPDRRVAEVRELGSREFEESRCYVMRQGDLHAFIPCGPVGTEGLGNHSHNDLFSLVVWASGVEWITDPGTGGYTGDLELRNRLRSVAAHATLQLGRREPNAFGSGIDDLFRLQEQARPEVRQWSANSAEARLSASHRGYSGSGDVWIHERSVRLEVPGRRWHVLDRLRREEGPDTDEVASVRYPLLPATRARLLEDGEPWPAPLREPLDGRSVAGRERRAVALSNGGAAFWVGLDLPAGSRLELIPSIHSPRYGVTRESLCVTASFTAAACSEVLTVLWSEPRP